MSEKAQKKNRNAAIFIIYRVDYGEWAVTAFGPGLPDNLHTKKPMFKTWKSKIDFVSQCSGQCEQQSGHE